MPLSLSSMNAAVVCNDKELETYDVKQEGTSSLTAFIASEAGKQFKITYSNNLTDFVLDLHLYIDGQFLRSTCVRSGSSREFLGPYNGVRSILPLKFQELQLVDPDLEDAPIASEAGTIELKVYRCRILGRTTVPQTQLMSKGLRGGRVSELSKKIGWHHVATGNEIPAKPRPRKNKLDLHYFDPRTGSAACVYQDILSPQRAQGIIPENGTSRQRSPTNNKKRAREDGSLSPSRSRQKIKREDLSEDAREQRIRALQGTSVKRERKSPIVVRHAREVVDLTLDD
ncbi:hypothetical protein H4582DRAFT_1932784 [Lactarius indigo]|nr:hypothetical protein H4582DRAFT_1932784 [Lactarius indigo]